MWNTVFEAFKEGIVTNLTSPIFYTLILLAVGIKAIQVRGMKKEKEMAVAPYPMMSNSNSNRKSVLLTELKLKKTEVKPEEEKRRGGR